MLASRIGFDLDVLRLVKQVAMEFNKEAVNAEVALKYYQGYSHGRLTRRDEAPLEGFSVDVAADVKPMVRGLRSELIKEGYLPFVFQQYYNRFKNPDPGCMVVLKTADQFDIIRAGYPEGNDDYVDNATILHQLQEWNRRYGIEIIGANGDWLEITCHISLNEAARFGAEAVALCPDLRVGYEELAEEHARKYYPFQDDEEGIEQQMGYVVGRDVSHSGRLFLWWD